MLSDDVHACPTRVISLENTLNGMILPLAEARRISAWARSHDIRVHCDGARLWEAAAAGAGTLREYADCFDTISLCFSKGLGAPIGSMLVGPAALLKHARWVRKSIGGGLRQAGVVSAAARVAVDETFGDGGALLRCSHEVARFVEKMWTSRGGTLVYPVQTNMVWLDLAAAGCTEARINELAREQGLRLTSGRVVCHYQIYQNREAVLPRLESIFTTIFGEKGKPAGAKATSEAAQAVGEKALYK